MSNFFRFIYIAAGVILLTAFIAGCKTDRQVSPEETLILEKCEELYTRIKVNDYEVIYDNEFPYLHEKLDLEEFLKDKFLQWYNPDTLVAVQIDSATIWPDTAYVHMQLEWLHADSTLSVQEINLRWHLVDDDWIKPTRSAIDQQMIFEEELRIYWEAVEAMQAGEKKKEESGE